MVETSLQGEEQKVEKAFQSLTDCIRNKFARMGPKPYSFSKEERLTGKKNIEGLFKEGSSFYLPAFQIRYHAAPETSTVHQVLISVPKRHFKRAVDRNLLKRRIREAYRLNKSILQESQPLYLGFVYISKQILSFQEIQDQLILALDRLKRNTSD